MADMPTVAPESFVSVCKAVYGDLIDPDAIWQDVAKRSPDQADMHVPGTAQNDRTRRRVTAGLSAVGAAAGAAGLGFAGAKFGGAARRAYKVAPAAGKIRRVGQAVKAGIKEEPFGAALVPGETLGLGGEMMATHILHGDTKKPLSESQKRNLARKLQPTGAVGKAFKLPKLDDVVAGSRKAMRDIVDSTRTSGPAPGTPAGEAEIATRQRHRASVQAGHPRNAATATARQRGVDRWGEVGYHGTRFLGTPGGKAATAGAAVVGTGAAVAANRKRKANAVYVDPYDSTMTSKSYDFEASGEISKIDEDKHLVFGWISVSKINGAPVVDKQNDYIDPADLEEAAYAYVHGSRVGGDMHGRDDSDAPRKVSDLVESVVFTPEKIQKMGLPADFPVGWWGGFKVHDEQAWDDVKKGRRTGFSVHGKGRRTDVDLDELMGT